jgi:RNA polymerase primary sigma factor
VAALASNLDAREARLMRLRYGLADGQTRSLAECAEAMGLGQTRVQQIAQKCLKKLREAEEMSSLEEYLLTIA